MHYYNYYHHLLLLLNQTGTMSERGFNPRVKLCFPAAASWLCFSTKFMFFVHTALL